MISTHSSKKNVALRDLWRLLHRLGQQHSKTPLLAKGIP